MPAPQATNDSVTHPRNFIKSVRRSPVQGIAGMGMVLASMVLISQTGCIGLASNLMHAVGADRIPPKYDGLEDQRVAVVTLTDASQYSNDSTSRFLSRSLGQILLGEVDDMRLVREDEIEQWRDVNGYDNFDFAKIGTDVKADKVVSVQISDMTLLDGASLYRGKANVLVEVIDPASGELLLREEIDEFTYPKNAGQHINETTEAKFERLYLTVLAEKIGRLFHPYDFGETVALDGRIASN
ncbi:MAG: hypothetical protein AAF989_13625 [Planctomycetota bacterium]